MRWAVAWLVLASVPGVAWASGDEVLVDEAGGGDYTTITQALLAATADDCIETIRLAPGTYTENIDLGGLTVTLVGESSESTIIAGSGAGRVVTIGSNLTGAGGPTLRNLTVQGGDAFGVVTGNGGCIGATGTDDLLLEGVVVRNCEAHSGGCISLDGTTATLDGVVAEDCSARFVNGTDTNYSGRGGAILVSGGEVQIDRLRVRDGHARGVGGGVTFDTNAIGSVRNSWISDSDALWGGGIGIIEGSTVAVTDSSVTDNDACHGGGGISVWNNGDADLRGVVLAGNAADGSDGDCPGDTGYAGGGAVWVFGSHMDLRDSLLHGNSAFHGGGVWASSGATALIERVVVRSNDAFNGGGGGVRTGALSTDAQTEDVTIRSSLFEGNEAFLDGGGLAVEAVDALLQGLLVRGNTTLGSGGGVALSGTGGDLQVHHNIVSGNTAQRGAGVVVQGSAVDLFNTTFAGGTCTGADEVGVVQLRPVGEDLEIDLYNVVVGQSGCQYAAALDVPAVGLTVFPAYSLLAPGTVGTENARMEGIGEGESWFVGAGNAPVFASSSPVAVSDFALTVQANAAEDGVDDGYDEGMDPDGSATDMGALGGSAASGWGEDGDGDGVTVWQGDCNDANAAIEPGASEVCNCVDDDCDGTTDEGCEPGAPCAGGDAPGDDDDSTGDDDDSVGDDDDSAGDDDDSAAWAPPPGCLAQCDASGGSGGAGLALAGVLLLATRRRRRPPTLR